MDTGVVWKERSASFWKEVSPYFRYVLSSGLAAFIVILFLVSTHFYARLLENLPEHFPSNWVAVVSLLPTIAISPIRTYLKSADIIYLLPVESKMKPYFQKALNSGFVVQAIIVAVVWFVVWPLFRESTQANGSEFLFILFILAVMKWVHCFGHWKEMQYVQSSHRRLMMYLRWAMSAVLLYILFTFHIGWAGIVIALVLFIYVLSLRIPASYDIHWLYLIERESVHRARFFQFLSWFVEVPEVQQRVYSRTLISRLTKFISFKQVNTYRYLYFITWIRSDLFGIVTRLMVIGMFMIVVFTQDLPKLLLFLFFIYLIGVQLSALAQYHRFNFWIQLYPIPEKRRIQSVHRVIFWIHFLAIHIVYIPLLLTYSSKGNAVSIYLLGITLFSVYHFILRKKSLHKYKDSRRNK